MFIIEFFFEIIVGVMFSFLGVTVWWLILRIFTRKRVAFVDLMESGDFWYSFLGAITFMGLVVLGYIVWDWLHSFYITAG